MAAGIFISYRRQESTAQARAVYERLTREFGAGEVFIDLEGLDYGEDFVVSLERQLANCRVLLALIGPQWVEAKDGHGQHRLHDENDFVRLEVATALSRGIRVVPVLMDNTLLPRQQDLPESLWPLRRRQALELQFSRFDAGMGELVRSLRRMQQASTPAPSPVAPPPAPAKPDWPSAAGNDAHGRWADLRVADVVQRMRWIEAGEFLMGSPDSEAERSSDEGPQHRVRISPGFWLADSACTQALWLAVMGGKNPSHFSQDLQNPVEQVRHSDAEAFLAKLQRQLPAETVAALPTEAQWEYACRAGTQTPFSVGANITPAQVNYDGNHPYAKGQKGPYRQKTVTVKSLPPNAWGLHEMHGNVWEWCADGSRTYSASAQALENPQGPAGGARRVFRGGSWDYGAGRSRSAFRREFVSDYRGHLLGFRLALRSRA